LTFPGDSPNACQVYATVGLHQIKWICIPIIFAIEKTLASLLCVFVCFVRSDWLVYWAGSGNTHSI